MVSRMPATMARLVRTPRPSRRPKPRATRAEIRRLMVDAMSALTDHRPTGCGPRPNQDIAAPDARAMPLCGDPGSAGDVREAPPSWRHKVRELTQKRTAPDPPA